MHPVLLNLPFGISIKAYGLMMMLGFFAATWWAMHRARLVNADPDVILNLGFISLVSGIVGARLFYVVQFWQQDFANQPNPLMAALNVTAGGLVFYGGFLLAVVCALAYLVWARHSIRLYLDILAPSLMVGLAFGRMGCFLNGCCWGAPTQKVPWALSFPYASPAFDLQWQKGLVSVPEQLLYGPGGHSLPMPIFREHIGMNQPALRTLEQAQHALEQARTNNADSKTIATLHNDVDLARKKADEYRREYPDLASAYEHYGLTAQDITELARHYRSLPVHPTQLYALVDAILIALLLHAIFLRRRQQGMVFGLLFIFYGIGRFLEEAIRGDNRTDWHLARMALTMSQVVSVCTFVIACVYLIILYRLPATPPTAVRFVRSIPMGRPKPVSSNTD